MVEELLFCPNKPPVAVEEVLFWPNKPPPALDVVVPFCPNKLLPYWQTYCFDQIMNHLYYSSEWYFVQKDFLYWMLRFQKDQYLPYYWKEPNQIIHSAELACP